MRALLAKIPLLAAATGIQQLEGGLTNTNYRVDTQNGTYFMRVSHPSTHLLGIDRKNEKVNTERAHQAGVGPAVIDFLPAEKVLVIEWINAKTIHAADFQSQPGLLVDVAAALRKLHAGPAFQGEFNFPAVRQKYLDIVLQNGFYLPADYVKIQPLVLELERALAVDPEHKVPCNNDLLAENFMLAEDKIWIIDYEYAGQNEPSFEIGNLVSESGLSESQLTTLCGAYWQGYAPAKIARARAWSMIARFGWVMWASIQEAVSPIDFDFRGWGLKKWNSVLPELTGEPYLKVLEALKNNC
ncbi:choline/ethanolamine kinase family protein [Flavihumibacter fluvii]|uniref:choline/ethanolamine kinase family protein n=1 Tax=Flavihumibacter fluvii TaxID=2838157 RepID=UPI001BDEDC59|nr:choline/ethanolamine kinase family protein [Flavihumibacter fluvii]ULQ53193.1 phosphotransferase family protein [Flavihumibacter fluvii]